LDSLGPESIDVVNFPKSIKEVDAFFASRLEVVLELDRLEDHRQSFFVLFINLPIRLALDELS